MPKYKIGIVGYGKIAHDQHAPAIMASPDFELAAISNVGSGNAPKGVPCYRTVSEMLESASHLDAVSLCTPPAPRRLIAAQCLSAGKHVLLEKPPAATVAEVNDIAESAKIAGKAVFAAYHAQHSTTVKAAAEALANQTLKSLQVIWKEDIRRWHPGQDWSLSEGGFGIFDPGINAFSILTRVLSAPVFISAAKLFFPSNRQAPIAADITFSTSSAPNGELKGTFDWRQHGPPTWEIMIETLEGVALKLADGGRKLEIAGQPPLEAGTDEYPDIYREFGELVEAGRSKVEVAPFQLVADAFMIGRRTAVEAFNF